MYKTYVFDVNLCLLLVSFFQKNNMKTKNVSIHSMTDNNNCVTFK